MSTKFTSELKEGMVTLKDAYSNKGQLVLPKNTVITKSIINRLISNDVLMVEIDDKAISETADIFSGNIIDDYSITSTPEYKKYKKR